MGKDRDGAWAALRLGGGRGLSVEAGLSPAALWAAAGLVGTALLGSAAIVAVARRFAPLPRLDRAEPRRLASPPPG